MILVYIQRLIVLKTTFTEQNKVHVPYMDSALNVDTLNTFKNNKFYRYMALHVREEKQLKR